MDTMLMDGFGRNIQMGEMALGILEAVWRRQSRRNGQPSVLVGQEMGNLAWR